MIHTLNNTFVITFLYLERNIIYMIYKIHTRKERYHFSNLINFLKKTLISTYFNIKLNKCFTSFLKPTFPNVLKNDIIKDEMIFLE